MPGSFGSLRRSLEKSLAVLETTRDELTISRWAYNDDDGEFLPFSVVRDLDVQAANQGFTRQCG